MLGALAYHHTYWGVLTGAYLGHQRRFRGWELDPLLACFSMGLQVFFAIFLLFFALFFYLFSPVPAFLFFRCVDVFLFVAHNAMRYRRNGRPRRHFRIIITTSKQARLKLRVNFTIRMQQNAHGQGTGYRSFSQLHCCERP